MSADLVLTDRAALTLIDEAEQALAEVSAPEEADELWRKVRAVEEAARLARVADATVVAMARVRLRAKRRWGELLGEPETKAEAGRKGGSSDSASQLPDADRKSAERARKLAGLPEPVFLAHLEHDDPDKLSEAELLRAVRELERLGDKQARANACQEATGRAKEGGRPVTARDVRAAVEARLPMTPAEPPAPAARRQDHSPGADPVPPRTNGNSAGPTPAAAVRSWPAERREERIEAACRIIRDHVGEIDIAADPQRWLRCLRSTRKALEAPVRRAQAAAGEALGNTEAAEVAEEADQLDIEVRRS